jgi:hypothetical protein
MYEDRRKHRSVRATEALQLFLESARDRLGVQAITVGTTDGWLIAGAGVDVDRVADRGAHAASLDANDADLATWQTKLGDVDIVLTSWGARMSADLADGVRRILAS